MKKELYGLTNPQKSIWLTEQYFKNTSVNNIGGTMIIKEKVNFELLKKAIYEYVKTNDSFLLKLCFDSNGDIKQYVDDFEPFPINQVSFSSIEELSEFEKKDCEEVFPIINSNLFRFTLFSLPNHNGGFIVTAHHIISDAQTFSQLATKIINIYSCFLNNKTPEILETSYIDFIQSEKEYLSSEKMKKDKLYWESVFSSPATSASLSTTSTDGSNLCTSSREIFTMKKEEISQINEICKQNNISIYHFFLTIFSLYIGKITNEKKFVIGTPILNRTNFKEKHTAGMFISTIPVLINLEKNITFKEFASQIAVEMLSIFRHQKYPYQAILEHSRTQAPSLPNLYNIMLSYQINKSDGNTNVVPYTTRWTHSNTNTDELDIHLSDFNDTGDLTISYDYQLAKFSKNDITRLHKRILSIISQVIADPNVMTNHIDLVLPEEKDFILNTYNKPIDEPITETVISLFEKQVKENPDKIAVSQKNRTLTYKELNNLANNLASILSENEIVSNDKVCLFLPNSIELVISILAVLKLGASYIPIDVSYPLERVEYIAENSECKKILTTTEQLSKLNKLENLCFNLDKLSNTDAETQNINNSKLNDLAYIIYTSGSTGKPKGVKIANESLTNYITWANKEYVNGEVTNFPLYSSISFDLTVTSVFTPLISGNTIYIYENSNAQLLLQEIIEDKKVQIIKLTPAHLTLLQDCTCDNSIVTKLIVGGDILTCETCKKVCENFGHTMHIYNEYGPTEATVGCMIYEYCIDSQNYASVPIGMPAQNTNLFVLNDDYNLIPFGYNGELYIAGKGLAKGYVNLPSVTASRFIACPFLEDSLMYKTGDIVKLFDNGIMEYLGRSDFQVKINGFRIETGEIQSKILTYPNIKDCFVTALDIKGTKVLCAYYVTEKEVSVKSLKQFLQKSLPRYMVPKYFVTLEQIPLTQNGKINKALLPPPVISEDEKYVAPENEIEKILHGVFCELLQINELSVNSNFFDHYIDSLNIIKAQTKLFSLGYNINTQDFYDYPSIRKLSTHILKNNEEKTIIMDDNIPTVSSILKNVDNNFKTDNILLFGATGFLGIHLLYELLTTTNSKVYCLIREKNNLNSRQRLEQKFKFYFPEEDINEFTNRIALVTGNILKDNFGLTNEAYSDLGMQIDCVIDSAALVKHYGEYENFDSTNVKGTERIIDFCLKYNLPLHYISTLSVSGFGLVKNPKVTYTENDFYVGQNYENNVYVKSKFEAEKLILNACKSNNLSANIYRMGNITNRFSDGKFQENAKDNAFLNRITAIINLKSIPNEILNMKIEFTPVDYCAKFIISLLTKSQPENNLTIYHLFNQNFLEFKNLFEFLDGKNINIKNCSLQDFKKLLLKENEKYFGIIGYISNIENIDFNGVTLENVSTNKKLQKLNLAWPKITKDYLEKLLDFLKNNSLI